LKKSKKTSQSSGPVIGNIPDQCDMPNLELREKQLAHREKILKSQEREVSEQTHQIASLSALVIKYENRLVTLTEEVKLLRLTNTSPDIQASSNDKKVTDGIYSSSRPDHNIHEQVSVAHQQPYLGPESSLSSAIALMVI